MAKSSKALLIGFENLLINRREFRLQPGEQRGAEIETDAGVIVGNLQDLPFAIGDPGIGVWPIAFEGNPLVPIVKRIGALLGLNDFKPRILPRGLVEMAVNGNISVFDFGQGQSVIYSYWKSL
jgi:hypothetical protein